MINGKKMLRLQEKKQKKVITIQLHSFKVRNRYAACYLK